jgi:hydrogenase-4 component B
VGGLAVACFVKVYGIVFLGMPRSESHGPRHEAGWQMLLPMLLLGGLCIVIGIVPGSMATLLHGTALTVLPQLVKKSGIQLSLLAPFSMITVVAGVLLSLIIALLLWYRHRLAVTDSSETVTWGCGYQRPTARMQYSASSFAELLTSLFAFVLKPQNDRRGSITGLFPGTARFASHVPEVVLELIYIPALVRLYHRTAAVRKLQSGIVQQYVLYSLITLILLLAVGFF